ERPPTRSPCFIACSVIVDLPIAPYAGRRPEPRCLLTRCHPTTWSPGTISAARQIADGRAGSTSTLSQRPPAAAISASAPIRFVDLEMRRVEDADANESSIIGESGRG